MAGRDLGQASRLAAATGAYLCSGDEAGQTLRPPKARTWARRGRTPVAVVSGKGSGRVSAAGMVCLRPGSRGRFFYRIRIHRGRKGERRSMSEADYASLVTAAHNQLKAPVILVWDRRGRRHPLAGLLAVGVAAVIAGSRSFAAIGQWAADAGPEVLAVLGATRGPAEESTFRRAFALVSADVLDRVPGAWLHTRAVAAGGRLVIAVDGKTVRGAKNTAGKAPHLVAALAHGLGRSSARSPWTRSPTRSLRCGTC